MGRLAWVVLALLASPVLALLASPGNAQDPVLGASFAEPTSRYDHGILGDAVEYGLLRIETAAGQFEFRQPDSHVFEDFAPRLWDIDGDGDPEVVVVDTDLTKGARLAIYDQTGLLAATPYIGQPHRWLAPIGAADLDGDGRIEIALIDRPHLARVLRLMRLDHGALVEVASIEGLTNHRIGDTYVSGGLRDCGAGAEVIVANADWTLVMAVRFSPQGLSARAIGPFAGPADMRDALECGQQNP